MIAAKTQERRQMVNGRARAEINRLQSLLGCCSEWDEKRFITLKLVELIKRVRE